MNAVLIDKIYCPLCTKTFTKEFDSSYGLYSYEPIYLVVKTGKYGKFLGCPNFPQCSYSQSLPAKKEVWIDYEDELRPY